MLVQHLNTRNCKSASYLTFRYFLILLYKTWKLKISHFNLILYYKKVSNPLCIKISHTWHGHLYWRISWRIRCGNNWRVRRCCSCVSYGFLVRRRSGWQRGRRLYVSKTQVLLHFLLKKN